MISPHEKENTIVNEMLRVLPNKPDLIEVLDKKIAEKLGSLVVSHPDVELGVLPINKLSYAKGALSDFYSKIDWLEHAVEDAVWANANQWLIHPEPSAWLVDHYMVIQAPYSLTFSDFINDITKKYYYSHSLNGWVVDLEKADIDSVDSTFAIYAISVSNNLADAIEGRLEWKSVIKQLVRQSKEAGYELPNPNIFKTSREYRPWQVDSILAMSYQGTSLLTDQVGLGKGGQFIGTALCINQFKNKDKIKHGEFPVVISVTKSMKHEIGEEARKWWSDAQVGIIEGRKPGKIEKGKDFYIINHDILDSRVDDLIELNPVGFIADECHVFKNSTAKRSKAALKISKFLIDKADKNNEEPFIIMASGTPFLNAPVELWSLLEILGIDHIFSAYARKMLDVSVMQIKNPKFNYQRQASSKNPRYIDVPLTNQGAFELYFCNAHFDKYHIWQNRGSAHVKELHKLLIDTGMIRRRKSDVMHPLPKLTESVVNIDLTDADWDEYDRLDEEFREWAIEEAKKVAEDNQISIKKAVNVIIRKLENGEEVMRLTKIRQHLGNSKVEGTVEWIKKFMDKDPDIVGDDKSREKLIVFVHHQEARRMLIEHPELQKYGIVTILPGGEQTGESIQKNKQLFQTDDRYRLMICSMAAREGHTLTAAKDVYLHEIPFVPSWVVQMAGRCWARLSEEFDPHEAYIHYAIVDDTEEPRLLQMNRIKKATFNAVIDGDGQDEEIEEMKSESIETLVRSIIRKSKELNVAA